MNYSMESLRSWPEQFWSTSQLLCSTSSKNVTLVTIEWFFQQLHFKVVGCFCCNITCKQVILLRSVFFVWQVFIWFLKMNKFQSPKWMNVEGHQPSATGVTLQRTWSLFLNVNKSTILLVFIQKENGWQVFCGSYQNWLWNSLVREDSN